MTKPKHHARRKAMRWVKRAALALGAAAALGAMIYAWLPKPVAVDVATVKRAPLAVEVEEDGTTRVRDRYVVIAPIGGVLDRIELEAGAAVKRDAVLGTIRPPVPVLLDPRSRDEAKARLAGAIAHRQLADTAIVRATAARDQAVREAERGRQLVSRQAIPIAEGERLDIAERVAIADRTAAELDRTAAAAEVEAARAALGTGSTREPRVATITSPVDGRVLRVVRDSAGPVVAGAALLELGDPCSLEVVIDVLSADAAKITPNMTVTLDGWGGDHPLHGRVRLVEPSGFTRISALGVEEQRVKVIVAIDDSPPTLGDGFRVDAKIVTWHGEALVVPASALFRDHDRWAVYTVVGTTARLVPVEVGHRGRTEVEVLSGLAAGTTVVLHPGDRVGDGAKVAVR